MSSILKALKKLEDGKAARPPGSLDIGADILRSDTRQRFSLPGVILVAGLLFICGSGATYLYLKHTALPNPSRQPPAAAAVQAERPAPPLPAPAVPHPSQQVTGATRTEFPQQHAKHDAVITPHAAPPQQFAKTRPTPRPVQKKTLPDHLKTAAADHATSPVVQNASAVTPPVIKVNGIAFQNDGSGSVAVVNGIPVANGSMIEGARVEEIQKDRVRFSYGGEKFEVSMGKSNR